MSIRVVTGKKISEIELAELQPRIGDKGVVIDLGTGDGKFAYNIAKQHPEVFVIGIDADKSQLEEISHKANRKPAKGGLDNVMYVWARAEELPGELNRIASSLYINFPWGSLLKGIARLEPAMMQQITALLQPDSRIYIYLSYDPKFEPETIAELELPELSDEYLSSLPKRVAEFDLALIDAQWLTEIQKADLQSSWPRKMLAARDRPVLYILLSN